MEIVNIEASAFMEMNDILFKIEKQLKGLNPSKSELNEWLDNQDVCILMNISDRKLLSLRQKGLIPFSRIDRKIYYKKEDILSYVRNNLKTYTNNRVEDQLFQMLYILSIDQIVDDKTLRIWVENDFEKIIKWENEYLKDMQNKLRQEHRFVDDCYSLDIYEDLKKLLGYKKYLDSYKEIETEDEMKYALLFGLKECPYPMYSCFVMQSIEADHGVSRGSGLY